ncbi:DUF3172 domain-containing protein [Thermosynechococcus sp. QKsg1]|uniref:DUF3172 domain-containing protein n=1 Tax=unclassified Thermosynechococcus TaxID=2622553 RepID=UPI00167FF5DF|nr:MULTISPECIES: DUF3172 domain-containing protein [unclassified Thermosynechococcus]WJI23680.1 DUF3172 domain-containing protein [Thermosynechococcus sp. B0]WJI26193.1 DUF3172 domain-containing protein [Thermosynechococcus sp. B1]WJI28718.1 DUF3172 domain-containing protein [Thermosynechococcus sp. B3]WKT83311.1 DUF3172 domain-containing protein [Thermosynechococcus sp. HY596]WNC62440.1 DUF3172 domain-containing protein [Thermosynechococcus sp. HY591]
MPRRSPSPPRPRPQTRRPPQPESKSAVNTRTLAVLGGVFIIGVGVGVTFSKTTTLNPDNVASTQFIDQAAPNPDICVQFGASAIAVDTRIFVTFNPFSVFVSQPVMQPGCVIRANNVALLEQRQLITGEQLRSCRQRLNTFGYVGNLESNPEISCVYQSTTDKNLFLKLSGLGNGAAGETGNF